MKKLLTVLFSFMIVFALAMPVFAAATGAQETTKTEKTKKTHAAKTKTKKAKTSTTAPTQ